MGKSIFSFASILCFTAFINLCTAQTGIITTLGGNGIAGFSGDGGLATSASLSGPTGVCRDANGNVYIADYGNNRVRKIDAVTGVITTIAGNGSTGYTGDG